MRKKTGVTNKNNAKNYEKNNCYIIKRFLPVWS